MQTKIEIAPENKAAFDELDGDLKDIVNKSVNHSTIWLCVQVQQVRLLRFISVSIKRSMEDNP